jgi:hypothetical protein
VIRATATSEAPRTAGIKVRGDARALLALEIALLLLGGAILCFRILPHAWRTVNTDFPNYYITARLVHEGYSTDRIYEWDWFARQKDRLGIDQNVVGFNSLTPISALALVPISSLDPITAKRGWILLNLLLLVPTLCLIRSLSGLPWRWLGIATLFSFPLYKNLEYGQYYLVLLLLLAGALWLYVRRWSATAGALVALAAGLKVFPIFFIFYFLKKRDWRATCGFLLGLALVLSLSMLVFGHTLMSRYAFEILPAALRGEAMDPYSLEANSISALVHHLFAYEPELNPHPVFQAWWAIAILQPVLQLLVLIPALLLSSAARDKQTLSLEWSTLIVALLAVSTLPASYHFVLLLLPCAVWAQHLLQKGQWRAAALCVVLYFLIGWPIWPKVNDSGWYALFGVPRLWLVLSLVVLSYRESWPKDLLRMLPQRIWVGAWAAVCLVQVLSLWQHEKDLYKSQQWRLSASPSIFSIASPAVGKKGLFFVAMTIDGWRLAQLSVEHGLHVNVGETDQLSVVTDEGSLLVERDSIATDILRLDSDASTSSIVVRNAVHPAISGDGKWLSFIRTVKGRGSLWVTDMEGAPNEMRVTEPALDVYDLSVGPGQTLLFSAANKNGQMELFQRGSQGNIVSLGILNARYPSLSPDGKWLAYSALKRGIWHLTLRDLHSGIDRQLGVADCNEFSPAWERDSRTLLYISDCGRGLWQNSLYRRTVVP